MTKSKWQPIETAPKDGTDVLVWRKDCGTLLARWTCAYDLMTNEEIEDSYLTEDELWQHDWFYADFIQGGRIEGDESPVLWAHVPEPRAAEQEGDV